MRRFYPPSGRSFALISTLLIVAVLALGALAFFQTARLDRIVTRNTENTLRAQMAAESGLGASLGWLKLALRRPGGGGAVGAGGLTPPYVVFLTNHDPGNLGLGPVLAVARRDAGLQTEVFPMVSGPLESFYSNLASTNNLQNFLALRANTNATSTVNLNLGGWIQHPQTTNWSTNADGSLRRIDGPAWSNHWYRVPWVYLTNVVPIAGGGAVTNVGSRFAFLVVDEQARLNPLVHGGFSGTVRTNSGASAEEILINSAAAPIVTNSNTLSLIRSQSGTLSTPDTLGLFIGTNAYRQIRHLVSVRSSTEQDLIPAGHFANATDFVAYADAGRPRYNLNNLVLTNPNATAAAERIGSIIVSNLPAFFDRDAGSKLAGLTNRIYANRLGAAMVDYIDADSIPTLVNGGEPAGTEIVPLPVLIAERITWVSESATGPPFTIVFRSEFFAQFWNPYDRPQTGFVALKLTGRQQLLMQGAVDSKFEDFNGTNFPPVPVTLQANEMRTFRLGQANQTFINPATRPTLLAGNDRPRWTNSDSGSGVLADFPAQFRIFWYESTNPNTPRLASMHRQTNEMAPPANAGLARLPFRFTNANPIGNMRWNFNYCPPNTNNTAGDPRFTYITQSDWAPTVNFDIPRWQGRQTDVAGRQQNFSVLWAPRDFCRADLPVGNALATIAGDPTALATTYVASQASNAPLTLRDGPMRAIGEIGNIFDPAQANHSGTSPFGGTPANYFRPGGGRSLRIGQPESPYWATNGGTRAMSLLDLFTVNTSATSGRINVNTAPPEVLAAVFDGIQISSDAGVGPATATNSLTNSVVAALIANRPYSRPGDLQKGLAGFVDSQNFAWTGANTNVGNAPANLGNSSPAMRTMDRMREELFARSFNLLTTKSQVLRIYVIGQALGKSTNALATSLLEATVELRQDTSGQWQPDIVMQK